MEEREGNGLPWWQTFMYSRTPSCFHTTHLVTTPHYFLSHITSCHILLLVTHTLLSPHHITSCHISLLVTYYFLSHITSCHILLLVTYYFLSHIPSCHHTSHLDAPGGHGALSADVDVVPRLLRSLFRNAGLLDERRVIP